MRKWLAAAVLLSIAFTLQACAPKAAENDCGFVQNSYGERVSWKDEGIVTLYLHESVPTEYIGAVQSAAATWERSVGHKLFNIDTNKISGDAVPRKDGKNVIYFLQDWEPDRSMEQGRTSLYWVGDKVSEADIRINAKNFQFYWGQDKYSNKVNIEALLLHEMGHVLGLKHRDMGGSVMATYLPSGVDRIQLASTDVTDLKCEY